MAKQALAIRLGPDDLVPLEVGDFALTEVQYVAGDLSFRHAINSVFGELTKLKLAPSETAIDLYLLASLVYAADTQVSRAAHSQDNWTRELKLILPVSNVDLWEATSEILETTLGFLTGDIWELEFRPRPDRFQQIASSTTSLFSPGHHGVQLFSGGMDSLIGTIDGVSQGMNPIFVSHAGEGSTSQAQQDCFDALKKHFTGTELSRVRGWLQFDRKEFSGLGGENTTRARSFLFFALGVLVASGMPGTQKLAVPENGLIALNIPLEQSRVGALSTRTTHPFYMARWQEIVKSLGLSVEIDNPYWNRTKGEMVDACKDQALLISLLGDSLSCSSPSKARWKSGVAVQHCGYCLPCIIRRASLLAGLPRGTADPTTYTLSSLSKSPLSTRRSEGQQIRAFQVATERLLANPNLARILIHKSGPLSDYPGRIGDYADVYLRGMQEVANLLQGVVTVSG